MYWLIIFVSIASISGHIATLKNDRSDPASPFFSANDRSRWCTIRSLVDHGTYEIDQVLEAESDIRWNTIDKVVHPNAEGDLRSYSSKPPLMPTMIAGKYWLLKKMGLTLADDTMLVARVIVFVTNVAPFVIFLILLAAMLERIVVHDWTRYFVLFAAGFGTFLTTFSVSLNNHLPAAFCVMAGCIVWIASIAREPFAMTVVRRVGCIILLRVCWELLQQRTNCQRFRSLPARVLCV